MRYRILGPVEVDDGRTRVIPRPQRRAVLAYLLLHANRVVTVEDLVAAVWGGPGPPSARQQIQANVSQLRRSLGDAVRSRPGGYRIEVGDGDLDAAVFAELIEKAKSDPATAGEVLREALALWRGPALAGAAGAFVASAAAELEALRRWAYNEIQMERVPRPAVPALLPAGVRGFTGRQEHLLWLDGLLDSSTVVVAAIEGTPGVGKTALAVHWAHTVSARFPDGQLYANLHGFGPREATGPASVLRGFLTALAVERMPAEPSALADLFRSELAGRRVLIVLDNARDAEQVRPLLPGTPGCAVVVTSRTNLLGLVAVDGAQAVTLDRPSDEEARAMLAARIGIDRVAAEPDAAGDVIAACARLPLALAVVAARAAAHPAFPLAALANELRGSLDSFTVDDPAADLRAVFSWSYRTLDTAAARLFRLLGLHPGPDITVAAAASLAGDRPPLAALTRAHLLDEHRPGRFAMHDLLHGYASELAFQEDPEALRRLLDHYVHTAYAAARLLDPHRTPISLEPPLPGVQLTPLPDIASALSWLDASQAVLLAMVDLSTRLGLDGHTWRLAWTLTEFLDRRGHWPEVIAVQQHALGAAQRSAGPAEQAQVRAGLARAYLRLGRYADAEDQYRRSLPLCTGDPAGRGRIHLDLATVFGRQQQHRAALDEALRSLELYETAGHPVGQARALNLVGWYHAQLGAYAETLVHCERALALQQELGHRHGEAATWDSLGYAHHHLGHQGEAVACYERALELLRDLGERYYEADTLDHLGAAHHAAGDLDAADAAWRKAVEILDALGHPDAVLVRSRLSPCLPTIRTLGEFAVVVGGESVKWPSHKARDALKILVARRGRPLSREALGELLWPSAKPDKVANRVSVALSTLRSVLGPHRNAVVSSGEAVRLDLSAVRVDVEDFLAAAASGDLDRAHSLYTGDFLASDAEWASGLRDETAMTALRVAHDLAQLASDRADYDAAVRHLLPVLARDPYDEPTHLAVVRLLHRAGRHGEARRRYREYAARMAELGVPASAYP